jgi:YbgC/YbaW family acyl-CoA thioester hydrolase
MCWSASSFPDDWLAITSAKSNPMPTDFHTTRRIEFADTDMAGIVHFANFFRFMEAAEVEFLRARGLSVKMKWEGQSIGFPRVSASCDFSKPARFEDVLDIAVRIRAVGRKSVTYEFDFFNGGEAVARGQITSVCCRVNGDSPLESIDIPAGIRARLEGEPTPREAPRA